MKTSGSELLPRDSVSFSRYSFEEPHGVVPSSAILRSSDGGVVSDSASQHLFAQYCFEEPQGVLLMSAILTTINGGIVSDSVSMNSSAQ